MVRSKMVTSLKGLLGASLLALSLNAQAAPLNLTLLDSPDIASFFINTSYNAASDTLSATGYALRFASGAESALMIAGGLYMLQANIDGSGVLSGGSITIEGTIDSLGYTSGTLLQGTLTDFGYGAGDTLEFLFSPTGGDLAGLYGSDGGIIMGQTGFHGSFHQDFGALTAVADVAAVPVPAAVWLMLSALAGLAGVRRR